MAAFEHPSAFVRRIRSPALLALGIGPMVAAVAAMIAFSTSGAPSMKELAFRCVLALAGMLAATNIAIGPPRRGDVRIDDEGVWLGGELVLARDDVVAVQMKSARASTIVLVPRKGEALELTLDNVFQTDEVLAALGRPTLTALRFETVSPALDRVTQLLRGSVAGALALGALACVLAVLSPWLFGLALAFYGLERAMASAIEVGRDGVLLTGLGGRRFIRFTDVSEVNTTTHGALGLTLTSGEQVVANIGPIERATVLAKRIERCRLAARNEIDETEARRLIGEDARTLADRIPELRKLGRPNASYRESSLSRDQLWRIVEDTSLPATTRLGAAVALSGDLAEPDRVRLRIAADATASPKTRVALEAVAAETTDNERLVQTLGELEDEEEAQLLEARKKT